MRTDTLTTYPTLPADTTALTTAKVDSLAYAKLTKGIVMQDPFSGRQVPPRPVVSDMISWIAATLILIFCVAGLRYRGNARYLRALIRDTVELRERNNMFDETVRESSLKLLLLILSAGSLGLLLYTSLPLIFSPDIPRGGLQAAGCILCVSLYILVTPLLCRGFAAVFAGSQPAHEWVKGFTAGMGLLALPAFPAALAATFYPATATAAAITVAICFGTVKILFICRAFSIFMKESSSWVLFLYYLCNLELIPLTLTFVAAGRWCAFMT